jgi:hypothetical protein
MYVTNVRRNVAIATLCATTALGLTACGNDEEEPPANASSSSAAGTSAPGSAPTPKSTPTMSALARLSAMEIISKAADTMPAARSLTVDMTYRSEGQSMAYHAALDSEGKCTGEISQGDAHAKIISTGAHFYLQADDAFLRQIGGGSAVELFHGKWMKSSATGSGDDDLSSTCDLKELTSQFKEKPNKPKKGVLTTFDGKRVIPVTDTDPKDGSKSTAYIAADGAPYVLKVVSVGGDEPGTALFSHFDEPVTVGAPPAAQTVDVDKLNS